MPAIAPHIAFRGVRRSEGLKAEICRHVDKLRRHSVKTSSHQARGRVSEISQVARFGYIEATSDGHQVYFQPGAMVRGVRPADCRKRRLLRRTTQRQGTAGKHGEAASLAARAARTATRGRALIRSNTR